MTIVASPPLGSPPLGSPTATATGGGSSGLDDATLATFQDTFDVEQYIETLTAPLLAGVRRDWHGQAEGDRRPVTGDLAVVELDIDPLAVLFQKQLQAVQQSMRKVQRKLDKSADQRKAHATGQAAQMSALATTFATIESAHDLLDTRMNDVVGAIARIGERLELVDQHKRTAEDALGLLRLLIQLNQNEAQRFEALVAVDVERGKDGEGESEQHVAAWTLAANTLRRLSVMARDVDLPTVAMAQNKIQSLAETLEKKILSDFDDAFKENDLLRMNRDANVLTALNGGASCVQMYVNQHHLFLQKEVPSYVPASEMDQTDLPPAELLADFQSSSVALPELLALYDRILDTVKVEWHIMERVFTADPSRVMKQFLDRVFQQLVLEHLDALLHSAKAQSSSLTYVRTVAMAFSATKTLVDSLTGLRTQYRAAATVNAARVMEDLFATFLENHRHEEAEARCLAQLLQAMGMEYMYFWQAKRTARRNASAGGVAHFVASSGAGAYFASFNAPTAAGPTSTTTATTALNTTAVMSHAATSSSSQPNELIELPAASLISSDQAILFLDALEESERRILDIAPPDRVPTIMARQFSILCDKLLVAMLDYALDGTLEEIAVLWDGKVEPDGRALQLILNVTQVCSAVQRHFEQHLVSPFFSHYVAPKKKKWIVEKKSEKKLPSVLAVPTLHRSMLSKKKDLFSRLERKCGTILHKYTQAVKLFLHQCLAKQKKSDYKPKESDIDIQNMQTSTSEQICAFLVRCHQSLLGAVDGANLVRTLVAICAAFHDDIVEHLRKNSITITGGLILSKDLGCYHATVVAFGIDQIAQAFDHLRQIGNLFLVKAENLRNLMEEGVFARMDAQNLWSFVMARADYNVAKLEVLVPPDLTAIQTDLV